MATYDALLTFGSALIHPTTAISRTARTTQRRRESILTHVMFVASKRYERLLETNRPTRMILQASIRLFHLLAA
jgi:hypothetical protein